MHEKKIIMLIITVLCAGFFLRIYHLADSSVWIDESFTLLAVDAIRDHGYPLLDSGLLYKNSILYNYLLSIFRIISGSVFMMRLPAVIFGTLTILSVFVLSREMFDNRTAIISATFMAFLSIAIAWSRQARGYAALQFMFVVVMYELYMFEKSHDQKNLGLAILITGLAIFTSYLGLVLIPVILITMFLADRKLSPWLGLSAIPIFIALAWNYKIIMSVGFSNNIFEYLKYLFFQHTAITGFGAAGIILMKKPREKMLFASMILIPLYLLSFHQELVHYRYLFPVLPFLVIPASYCVAKPGHWLPIAGFFFIAMLTDQLSFTTSTLEIETPQPDFHGAYDFVKDKDVMIISCYPSVSKVYGVTSDYALDFRLDGREHSTMRKCSACNRDKYCNIELIEDNPELVSILNQDAYIVVDKLALSTMDPQLSSLIRSMPEVFSKGTNRWSEIHVYEVNYSNQSQKDKLLS